MYILQDENLEWNICILFLAQHFVRIKCLRSRAVGTVIKSIKVSGKTYVRGSRFFCNDDSNKKHNHHLVDFRRPRSFAG